jgi:hypothetical protein
VKDPNLAYTQYQVKVSSRFVGLGNFYDNMDINKNGESIGEIMKASRQVFMR